MRRFFPAICVLFMFTAAAVAGEQPRDGHAEIVCADNPSAGKNKTVTDDNAHDGYAVFPVQAPQPCKKENNGPRETSDDSEFTDSLRMFLGIKGPKPPDCFRQPKARGLLRDE